MPLVSGAKLGPYEVAGPLGAGGMGEVYRARDTRLGRDVAIKILPAQVSNDPVRKQRFEREAKTISRLNHPHICTLHDIGSQDGVEYLVMECLEGETLAKRLEKGPLPLEQVLKYCAGDACSGFAAVCRRKKRVPLRYSEGEAIATPQRSASITRREENRVARLQAIPFDVAQKERRSRPRTLLDGPRTGRG